MISLETALDVRPAPAKKPSPKALAIFYRRGIWLVGRCWWLLLRVFVGCALRKLFSGLSGKKSSPTQANFFP